MRSSKNEEQQQHKDHQARKRQRNSSDHTKEGMRKTCLMVMVQRLIDSRINGVGERIQRFRCVDTK